MKIGTLLTARAGSKSVLNKNLYILKGVPLYQHNISHALSSEYVDNLYVTTDSKSIIDGCMDFENDRIKVIVRPDSLCTDNSSHYHTIMHGLQMIEEEDGKIDILIVLLGNTPHAYTTDLNSAIEKFLRVKDKYDSCISVSKFNMFNPYRALKLKEDDTTLRGGELERNATVHPFFSPTDKVKEASNKDAFGDSYFFNGSFWICNRETLTRNEGDSVFPWLGKVVLPYVQPEGYMEVDATWQLDTL